MLLVLRLRRFTISSCHIATAVTPLVTVWSRQLMVNLVCIPAAAFKICHLLQSVTLLWVAFIFTYYISPWLVFPEVPVHYLNYLKLNTQLTTSALFAMHVNSLNNVKLIYSTSFLICFSWFYILHSYNVLNI